jgi:hypothetical protein
LVRKNRTSGPSSRASLRSGFSDGFRDVGEAESGRVMELLYSIGPGNGSVFGSEAGS